MQQGVCVTVTLKNTEIKLNQGNYLHTSFYISPLLKTGFQVNMGWSSFLIWFRFISTIFRLAPISKSPNPISVIISIFSSSFVLTSNHFTYSWCFSLGIISSVFYIFLCSLLFILFIFILKLKFYVFNNFKFYFNICRILFLIGIFCVFFIVLFGK